MSADIATLFTNSLIEETTLNNDPWGNAWHYTTISYSETIEGVPVTVHLATIHTRGKDEVNDSATIASKADYASWSPADDDIGVKFSTIEIEKERVDRYREQGQLIISKLQEEESARYITADTTCISNPADAICTHDSDLSVTRGYAKYNYYPQSSLDSTDAIYFDPDVTTEKQTYTSGNSTDMEQLMTDLGLPTAYATDPWGRTLHYSSNARARAEPPFSAAICFSGGGSCF